MMHTFAFLDLLKELPESDPRHAHLMAGFLVVRTAESAMRRQPAWDPGIEYAHRHVKRVPDLKVLRRLRGILVAARCSANADAESRETLCGRLLGYGVELHDGGFLAPAVDVFSVLCNHADDLPALRMEALLYRAFSLRLMSQFENADLTYDMLREVALQQQSTRMELEADLGKAKTLLDRGNYPAAEPIINSVIKRGKRRNERRVVGKALIDLARVAGTRHDPVGVVKCCHEALRWLRPGTDRDRCMVNVAIALREMGRLGPAKSAALQVQEHGDMAEMRDAATILLYQIAIDTRDFLSAALARGRLSNAALPPFYAAEYWEAIARDESSQHNFTAAKTALDRMMRIANEHDLHELSFRAETAMRDVAAHVVPAIYDFRPVAIARADRRSIVTIEQSIDDALADARSDYGMVSAQT